MLIKSVPIFGMLVGLVVCMIYGKPNHDYRIVIVNRKSWNESITNSSDEVDVIEFLGDQYPPNFFVVVNATGTPNSTLLFRNENLQGADSLTPFMDIMENVTVNIASALVPSPNQSFPSDRHPEDGVLTGTDGFGENATLQEIFDFVEYNRSTNGSNLHSGESQVEKTLILFANQGDNVVDDQAVSSNEGDVAFPYDEGQNAGRISGSQRFKSSSGGRIINSGQRIDENFHNPSLQSGEDDDFKGQDRFPNFNPNRVSVNQAIHANGHSGNVIAQQSFKAFGRDVSSFFRIVISQSIFISSRRSQNEPDHPQFLEDVSKALELFAETYGPNCFSLATCEMAAQPAKFGNFGRKATEFFKLAKASGDNSKFLKPYLTGTRNHVAGDCLEHFKGCSIGEGQLHSFFL